MVCCKCNSSGQCKKCTCVKAKKRCTNCLPSRLNQCHNQQQEDRLSPTSEDTEMIRGHAGETGEESEKIRDNERRKESETDRSDDIERLSDTGDSTAVQPLPSFMKMSDRDFKWGAVEDTVAFVASIDEAYAEVVYWRQNQFMLPSGKEGKAFVCELARMFQLYGESSPLERIALKCAMILPSLVLQKPHPRSRSADHVKAVHRRLQKWKNGDISDLLYEGRTIQQRLPERKQVDEEKFAKVFTSLMFRGKVRDAIRWLNKQAAGVLSLEDQVQEKDCEKLVRDILREKHPASEPAHQDAILTHEYVDCSDVHPVIFDSIDALAIKQAALRVNGAAGPSGADAQAWKRFTTSFGAASDDLCSSLACMARRIATTNVDPEGLTAYTACRLIALNKNPGVRPIGVGETPRRIIGKAILKVIKPDILKATGNLQLCAGQEAGVEAAVHAVRILFQDESTDAALLVDASNAFNRLNRQVALRNFPTICPALATIATNLYREDSNLFIDGETLLSQEGVTQGDPLAMAIYAVGIMPLIWRLQEDSDERHQVWFADDASANGSLNSLRSWWDKILVKGPLYGYYANPSKTVLIVKKEKMDEAQALFDGTGLKVTTDANRYLGSALGSEESAQDMLRREVKKWSESIKELSNVAKIQPHAAYAAFVHGIRNQWSYLMRTTPDLDDLVHPLEEAIVRDFIPALVGREVTDEVRELLALPARLGGLDISIPTWKSADEYDASTTVTQPLVASIVNKESNYGANVEAEQKVAKNKVRLQRKAKLEQEAADVRVKIPQEMKRNVDMAQEKGASSWLTVIPVAEYGFALHKGDFRDALCIRYNWTPPRLPSQCACGQGFSVSHAMDCPKGGFPSKRHNLIRDITADWMTEVCDGVAVEPPLQPLSGEQFSYASAITDDNARSDICAQGFWGNGSQRAFFDVRICNPTAQSYRNSSLEAVYRSQERGKRRQYEERIREVEMSSFTPLVFSIFGGTSKSTAVAYKRLADLISVKRSEPYGQVISWIRIRINFALLKSSINAIRGYRSRQGRPVKPDSCTLANNVCRP